MERLTTPCWWCRSFAGMSNAGTTANCSHPDCCRCRSDPWRGCATFEREPFVDDEEWPPEVAVPDFSGMQPWGAPASAQQAPALVTQRRPRPPGAAPALQPVVVLGPRAPQAAAALAD